MLQILINETVYIKMEGKMTKVNGTHSRPSCGRIPIHHRVTSMLVNNKFCRIPNTFVSYKYNETFDFLL